VPYLSRFYKVARPDARGLGTSSADFDIEREITIEALIEDLVAVIDDIGAQSVHFCGESMGGILGIAPARTASSAPILPQSPSPTATRWAS